MVACVIRNTFTKLYKMEFEKQQQQQKNDSFSWRKNIRYVREKNPPWNFSYLSCTKIILRRFFIFREKDITWFHRINSVFMSIFNEYKLLLQSILSHPYFKFTTNFFYLSWEMNTHPQRQMFDILTITPHVKCSQQQELKSFFYC